MLRKIHYYAAGLLVLALGIGVPAVLAATLVLQPVADSEAASNAPDENYGYNGTLRVDTQHTAYLRFDLGPLYGATINSASLQLTPLNGADASQTVNQMADAVWAEDTLTWNNRPTGIAATLASFGPLDGSAAVTVDMSAAVAGHTGGSLTLAISGTNAGTLFLVSRQGASNKPTLTIDYNSPPHSAIGGADFRLGVNIEAPVYWGTELPFMNLMKLSGGWYTQCNPYGTDSTPPDPLCASGLFPQSGGSTWDTLEEGSLALDADGWPTSLPQAANSVANQLAFTRVTALVPAGLSPQRPTARLIVKYDGTGSLQYELYGSVNTALSTPGRDVLDVQSQPGQETSSMVKLKIVSTDPAANGDYLRNIRVVPDSGVCTNDATVECNPHNAPAAGDACGGAVCQSMENIVDQQPVSQPFHPSFLANIKRFGVLRTMNFQNTNNAQVVHWAERTRPTAARWVVTDTNAGAPLEVVAALGNQSGADLWINVPTQADDTYVQNMAAQLRDLLGADRRVYLEYANEAWNTAFAAGQWMEGQATALWPAAADSAYAKRLNWYAKRSVEVCGMWKQVWAQTSADRAAKITCVIGTQATAPTTSETVLDCPLYAATRGGRPCYSDLDALAAAPYFGYYVANGGMQSAVEAWTSASDGGLNTLFQELTYGGVLPNSPSGGALQDAASATVAQLAVARDRGLPLFAYEAGQHLVGTGYAQSSNTITTLFTSANRDSRMGGLYTQYLNTWRNNGGGPMMLWNSVGAYSQYGSWGLLEYRDQGSSAKMNAINSFLNAQ